MFISCDVTFVTVSFSAIFVANDVFILKLRRKEVRRWLFIKVQVNRGEIVAYIKRPLLINNQGEAGAAFRRHSKHRIGYGCAMWSLLAGKYLAEPAELREY